VGQASEHGDELIREFTLIAAQLHDHHPDMAAVPVGLAEFVEALTVRYGALSVAQESLVRSPVSVRFVRLEVDRCRQMVVVHG
jgi:hypothetical protein